MKYGEAFTKLTSNICAIIFIKANGQPRCMLATRHVSLASRYSGFFGGEIDMLDRRNARNKDVLAVIDLEIGETRSLNTGRLVNLIPLTEPTSREEFNQLVENFTKFKEAYMEEAWGVKSSLSIDTLDEEEDNDSKGIELANKVFGVIEI